MVNRFACTRGKGAGYIYHPKPYVEVSVGQGMKTQGHMAELR